MEYIKLGKSDLECPRIALGCMRLGDKPEERAKAVIAAALDEGVNMFDHADIYADGESERKFGRAFKALGISRDKVILQSKCGIRKDLGTFDFSKKHIVEAAEGSLKRLGTDYLDILLLHRPDALMEPEEVAEAFDALFRAGKVRFFGVSNFSPYQIELLKGGRVEVIANQLQFSLMHAAMVEEGLNVNMYNDESVQRNGDILNYCRLNGIAVQAWSPLNYGFFGGIFVGNGKFPALNAELSRLGEKYGCTPAAIAFAWILRHPAKMQVIAGTTDPEHLRTLCRGAEVGLTREEWYGLYRSTGKILP